MRILILLLACILSAPSAGCSAPDPIHVYVGTYTQGTDSKGIYRFDLDPKTGQASEAVPAGQAVNPSFLAVHPSGKFLYATGETAQFQGKNGGSVSAFAIQPDGSLTPLNTQPAGGAGPCHVNVDPSGRWLLVANYVGGSAASLPIAADGSLGPAASLMQHKDHSAVNQVRQEAPHAHSINLSPDQSVACVADLGADRIYLYDFDAAKGTLAPHDPPFTPTPPGGGPRHLAFHPNGRFAYTNNEITSSVTAMWWEDNTRSFRPLQTLSTLPRDLPPHIVAGNTTAEVVVHPAGRFLYVSNRGHDTLALFQINDKTGELTPLDHIPTGGKIPRNFAITPDGRFLLAANQESNTVVVFTVDAQTGLLVQAGQVAVPKPVCVRFVATEPSS